MALSAQAVRFQGLRFGGLRVLCKTDLVTGVMNKQAKDMVAYNANSGTDNLNCLSSPVIQVTLNAKPLNPKPLNPKPPKPETPQP